MTEEQIAALMREVVAMIGRPDVERPLSYMADDVTWEAPEGTFRGKEQLKRYLTWLAEFVPDLTISESGIGVVVQGNRAAFEHRMEGTVEGTHCNWLALCAYEFQGDKIQHIRTVQDRLTILNQAAKGWLEETVIHSLVKRAEKGLH
jgi:hypothetical protein